MEVETVFPMTWYCISRKDSSPNTYIVCVLCVDVGCTLMACMRVWCGQSERYKGAAISGYIADLIVTIEVGKCFQLTALWESLAGFD